MKVKILRGVCVGVEDYAEPGAVRDLDPATADYLKNLGAAEDAPPEAPAEPAAAPAPEVAPGGAGDPPEAPAEPAAAPA